MALLLAITDIEQLKDRPELARLLAWKAEAIQGAKFDRNELSIYIERTSLREACSTLKNDPELNFDSLADLTCVDWEPSDPRFEVIYHLFSTVTKKRLRLKVRLSGDDARVDSLTAVWRGAEYLEGGA